MKNLILYILLLAGTFYVLFMYNQPSLYYILLCEILLLPAMAIYILLIRKAAYARLILAHSTASKQKKIPFQIIVTNRSRLPVPHYELTLQYQNQYSQQPEQLIIYGSVAGRQQTTHNAAISSAYCGTLEVRMQKLKIHDVLKLFSHCVSLPGKYTCTILPAQYPTNIAVSAATRYFPGEGETYSQSKSGDDPSEVFRIREYQSGDRPQTIHWKLTARTGHLMVRENSLPLSYPVLLLLDIREEIPAEEIPQVLDACIETLLALSAAMLAQECYHYIAWYDSASARICRHAVDSEQSFTELMARLLAQAPPTPIPDCGILYQKAWPYSRHCSRLRLNEQLELIINETPAVKLNLAALEKDLADLNLIV